MFKWYREFWLRSQIAAFTGMLTVVARVGPPAYESGTSTFTSLQAETGMKGKVTLSLDRLGDKTSDSRN